MKDIIRFALLFLCSSSTLFGIWEAIGPFGGTLTTMATAPANENIIYVATNSIPSRILKSYDGGTTWSEPGIGPYMAYSSVIDRVDPEIVYIGGYDHIYKTTNGGASWISYTFPGNNVFDIVVHPNNPSVVYAVGQLLNGNQYAMTFFKSTDGGVNWTSTPLNSFYGHAYCIIIDPANSNTIYVGGYFHNINYYPACYKSTDGGDTFIDLSSGFSGDAYYIYSLAIHPTNPSIIYAGTFNGIYRSTDTGLSWSLTSPSFYGRIFTLATTQASPYSVYAGSDSCVYRSSDEGVSWDSSDTGLVGDSYTQIIAPESESTVVYAVNAIGFFKTSDCGAYWFPSNNGMNTAQVYCIGISPSTPTTLYSESKHVGIYKSTTSGDDWTFQPTPSECGHLCDIVIHRYNPDTVYAYEGYD